MADPQVASYVRFDHRQATHLLQHCSSTSQKNGLRLHQKAKPYGPVLFKLGLPAWQGLINSTQDNPVNHSTGLLNKRAKPLSLKPPFQPLMTQKKPKRMNYLG